MGYDYATERPKVFTEEGQVMFLQIRDWLAETLSKAGAARMQEIIAYAPPSGDSWTMLACIDRLIELNEIQWVCKCNHVGPHTYCVVELADHSFGCELHPNE